MAPEPAEPGPSRETLPGVDWRDLEGPHARAACPEERLASLPGLQCGFRGDLLRRPRRRARAAPDDDRPGRPVRRAVTAAASRCPPAPSARCRWSSARVSRRTRAGAARASRRAGPRSDRRPPRGGRAGGWRRARRPPAGPPWRAGTGARTARRRRGLLEGARPTASESSRPSAAPTRPSAAPRRSTRRDDVRGPRPQGQAHADLVGAAAHGVGQDGVDAEARQQQGLCGEGAHQRVRRSAAPRWCRPGPPAWCARPTARGRGRARGRRGAPRRPARAVSSASARSRASERPGTAAYGRNTLRRDCAVSSPNSSYWMSGATPTTRSQATGASEGRPPPSTRASCWPSAPSGQKRRASARLTIGHVARRRGVLGRGEGAPLDERRPQRLEERRRGRDEDRRRLLAGRDRAGRSIARRTGAPPSSVGMLEVKAAPVTPGSGRRRRSSSRSSSARFSSGVVGVARDVEAKRQQRLVHEAGRRGLQPQEAADHQARAHEQGQAQRHLPDDERGLEPLLARPPSRCASRRAGRRRDRVATSARRAAGRRGRPRAPRRPW